MKFQVELVASSARKRLDSRLLQPVFFSSCVTVSKTVGNRVCGAVSAFKHFYNPNGPA